MCIRGISCLPGAQPHPTRLTQSAWLPASRQLCTSLISHKQKAGTGDPHIRINYDEALPLHEVCFHDCSASHFLATSTGKF